MKSENKTPGSKNHKILDHPILGYFLLAIIGLFVSNIIGAIIDTPIGFAIPEYMSTITVGGVEYQTASGVGIAIASIGIALIYIFRFRPKYRGFFTYAGVTEGLFIVFPIVVLHVTGSIVSICAVGLGDTFIALLRCLAPGFSEEIIFRGMGVSNYMRTIKNEKQIPVIFWLSSIVFGFAHMSNSIVGADLKISLLQSLYAVGVGMLFAAVYLKCGSLWPTIIAHSIIDYFEFCRFDISASSGVMSSALTVGDWITIIVGLLAGIFALYQIRKSERPAIMKEWSNRWNGIVTKSEV